MDISDLIKMKELCKSEPQRKVVQAVIDSDGNQNAAARILGINRRSVNATMKRIEGYANKFHKEGFEIKGESTLYDDEGNVKLKWVKTQQDGDYRQYLESTIYEAFDTYKGTSRPVKTPKRGKQDLLNLFPFGDPHVGMYAWAEESGEDFDCDIAQKDLIGAMTQLVQSAPEADTAVILNLGDFFHSDNQSNRTARSGNTLDVDGRWAKVYSIGVQIMIACIEVALKKHRNVIVRNVIGNHDEHTSQTLSVALSCFFSNNKRVKIDLSPSAFWYYKFGKNLFGSTHGDMAKPNDLPLIMANDAYEMWGDTLFRYWHTGHIHHDHVKDFTGCRWESHRTLAGKDAWHSAMGYRSQRDMKAITYHKEYGEFSRQTLNIARLRQ